MAWGSKSLNTYILPAIGSYEKAEEVWERSRKMRADGNTRRLVQGDRNKFIKRVYEFDNEGNPATIAFALMYGHELVRWHSDKSVTIHLGSTLGHTQFANHMLPENVSVNYGDRIGRHVQVNDGRLYRLKEPLRLRWSPTTALWEPTRAPAPWRWPTLDKGRARIALKAMRYRDFADWLRAVLTLDLASLRNYMGEITADTMAMCKGGPAGWESAARALVNPEMWLTIVHARMRSDAYMTSEGLHSGICDFVRDAIYVTYEAVTIIERDTIYSTEREAYYRAHLKYRRRDVDR